MLQGLESLSLCTMMSIKHFYICRWLIPSSTGKLWGGSSSVKVFICRVEDVDYSRRSTRVPPTNVPSTLFSPQRKPAGILDSVSDWQWGSISTRQSAWPALDLTLTSCLNRSSRWTGQSSLSCQVTPIKGKVPGMRNRGLSTTFSSREPAVHQLRWDARSRQASPSIKPT